MIASVHFASHREYMDFAFRFYLMQNTVVEQNDRDLKRHLDVCFYAHFGESQKMLEKSGEIHPVFLFPDETLSREKNRL